LVNYVSSMNYNISEHC